MFLYLAGKLAIVAVYYFVRLIPIVGLKLSDRYEDQMFGPLVKDVSVTELTAERSGRSVSVELELDNDSTLDAHVVGGSVRWGTEQDSGTVCAFLWTEHFDTLPKNVEATKIEGGEGGTLRLEHCVDDDDLWVDGELRLRRVFTVRGQEMPLGVANLCLPEESVSVESSEAVRANGNRGLDFDGQQVFCEPDIAVVLRRDGVQHRLVFAVRVRIEMSEIHASDIRPRKRLPEL